MNTNKLTLNYSKTKSMLFSNKNKERRDINIIIDSNEIECVTSFKYLGIIIDQKLSWDAHAKYLKTKLSQANGAIFKLRRFVSRKTMLSIYNSLVGSHLS